MGVNRNVFGSGQERNHYYSLSRKWGEKYRIYHNLPFLNVFNLDNLIKVSGTAIEKIKLDDWDVQRLKKTSIDYTFCNENDTPQLCIEFDGLQEGFNTGSKYHPVKYWQQPDSWRQRIMELKLTVASGSLMPFFVVGSNLFSEIAPDVQVSIVDGIIGDFTAKRASREKLSKESPAEYFGYSEDEFMALEVDEKDELVQNFVTDVEVSAEMEHNLVWQESAKLSRDLKNHFNKWSVEYLSLPDITSEKSPLRRLELLQNATHIGAKVAIHTHKYGEIISKVMIPNFDGITGWGGLTEEIAMIIGLKKLQKLVETK